MAEPTSMEKSAFLCSRSVFHFANHSGGTVFFDSKQGMLMRRYGREKRYNSQFG
jgi:hypothetical protein